MLFNAINFKDKEQPAVNAQLKNMFTQFLTDPAALADMTSADFIQLVDDKEHDKAGFIKHASALGGKLADLQMTFEEVNGNGNVISDIHIVEGTKKDGSTFKTKVIAFYYFENGKLKKIDELTQLLEGSKSDASLGSTTE